MHEPVTSYPQAVLLAITTSSRYRPGQQHDHNGFLQHAFAISPWLGAAAVALMVLMGLVLALIKTARRVLKGTPWPVRLALLATAGLGIFRLLSRREQATAQRIRHPPEGWQPAPPPDPAA
jgi:hypothetical protein